MNKKINFGGCEWRVLDVKDNEVLILSDTILGQQFYHGKHDFITWADCDLRKLLNEKFYNVFDATEKARIIDTTVITNDNPRFGTGGGISTTDKVFLLSIEELIRYFGDSGQIKGECSKDMRPFDECIDDEYNDVRIARDRLVGGIYEWWRDVATKSAWWLRSAGGHGTCTAFVDCHGRIKLFGGCSIPEFCSTGDEKYLSLGVRPALWVKTEI